MKRNIKLTESQFNKFIVETCKKVLNEDMAYMSDEDIANQYSDMKITYFEINPLRNSEGWEGTFELEFPNADDIDYDSTMVNDFFVYDSEGNRIAWDNWMPDEQTNYLNDIIRKEILLTNVRHKDNMIKQQKRDKPLAMLGINNMVMTTIMAKMAMVIEKWEALTNSHIMQAQIMVYQQSTAI